MSEIESRYQENGFQLIVYRERKPDEQIRCPECKRLMFHVATVYDEWTESTVSITHYYHCKREPLMVQYTLRTDEPHQRHTTVFLQPPHELQVELLATARQQNGRNVTQLTLNRYWWAPRRYPLDLGDPIKAGAESQLESTMRLHFAEDDPELPIPRYEPRNKDRPNPFTSRKGARNTTPEQDLEPEPSQEQDASNDKDEMSSSSSLEA